MKYIPVTGLNPVGEVKDIILNHFNASLISMAEPTTSRGWSIHQVFKQMNKIFKNFDKTKDDRIKILMIDSGGFQILMNYISKNRLREYIDTYHILLKQFQSNIDYIFSLDVLNKNLSKEEIFEYNKYSIESSLKIFKKYPNLKDKQLFIVQSRFPETLEIWKKIIDDNNIFDIYSRYSFGGLVGLKKETNAKFNHFVPMLFWLLTYAKSKNKENIIKHVHMLGQSSRLAIITAIILEEILNIEITMDSSEILRFSPIEAKLPLIYKNHDDEFDFARDKDHLAVMIANNIKHKHRDYNLEEALETLKKTGKVSNPDFVEIVCQGIDSTLEFGYLLKNNLIEDIRSEKIFDYSVQDFKNYHSIFKHGRLAQELVNNLQLAKTGMEYYKAGNFQEYHLKVKEIIENYYK